MSRAHWFSGGEGRVQRFMALPSVRSARRTAVKALNRAAGDTAIAGRVRAALAQRRAAPRSGALREVQRDGIRRVEGSGVLIVECAAAPSPRRGIYLWGGCDLPAAFYLAPTLRQRARGTVAVYYPPGTNLPRTMAAISLQTLQQFPADALAECRERIRLPERYFEPDLFDPTFTIPGSDHQPFPKSVVLLSLGAELVRTAYRHREHGFLVDPGGGWLAGGVGTALNDKENLAWFSSQFEKVPRTDVDELVVVYRELIETIRRWTGAHVVVFNTLTVEPGDRTHNYQLRRVPEGLRRRRFHCAIADLSAEMGFSVVDVDRTLKRAGIAAQVDFAKFPADRMEVVAEELRRALDEVDVL